MTDSDKRFSLLKYRINYDHRKFYDTGSLSLSSLCTISIHCNPSLTSVSLSLLFSLSPSLVGLSPSRGMGIVPCLLFEKHLVNLVGTRRVKRKVYIVAKHQLTGRNPGGVFNYRSCRVYAVDSCCIEAKRYNLK